MVDAIETAVVWFRRDLRLTDHPALRSAVDAAARIVPAFVAAPDGRTWSPGPAKRWWIRESVRRLDRRLREKGSKMVLRRGPAAEVLPAIAEAADADALYFQEQIAPADLDDAVAQSARAVGLEVHTHPGRILHDPDEVRTTSGGPYHVFTPFWRRFQKRVEVGEPLDAPELTPRLAPEDWPESLSVDELYPAADEAAAGLAAHWEPGAEAARARLEDFVESGLADYPEMRDRPDVDGTSRLSPRLHAGELSPRQIWNTAAQQTADASPSDSAPTATAEPFLRQLAWREFSYHLFVHYPSTATEPLREKFEDFPWESNEALESRWRRGQTGYPLVDAGMRQLASTGWMHNRVRMVVASFLTKDLRIPWQTGAEWFWQRLVDADLPNNTMGWQWAAGCGADAQPFFRIFNPVKQSRRHDPTGAYIRRHVPELDGLGDDAIHAPWRASEAQRRDAGVELEADYPTPIVDHAEARERALAAWERIK